MISIVVGMHVLLQSAGGEVCGAKLLPTELSGGMIIAVEITTQDGVGRCCHGWLQSGSRFVGSWLAVHLY